MYRSIIFFSLRKMAAYNITSKLESERPFRTTEQEIDLKKRF